LDVVQDRAVALAAGLITGIHQASERVTHTRKFVDAPLEVGDPAACHRLRLLARIGTTVRQMQQILNVVEGETKLLCTLDEPDHLHRVGGVNPITGAGSLRFSQQAAAFVVAQRLNVDLRFGGNFAASHLTRMNPVPDYRVKPTTNSC